ncbi:hypothetical protein AVEN_222316-1 [Araneus ventricosus]|uniref:Uncharacterized protein n=1 Tax=Araneus ventricosus TaxID=182803 RepID=A0A4Y2EVN7_ARAVE|nr:hypothetical protein AVEN_222316-1 [Araneus ventricosus]
MVLLAIFETKQEKESFFNGCLAIVVFGGNEQADFLAKKGANLLQHPNAATSYWKIKLSLKNLWTTNSLRDLQTRTALKNWRRVSSSSIPDKPRRDAVAAFCLNTGHDCLSAHLHRLGFSTEPSCPLCDCGEVMERDHLLRYGALQGLTELSRYCYLKKRERFWGNDFGLLFLLHILL